MSQQRTDDVRIVVGPYPLARVAFADRPKLGLGQHAEIRFVASDHGDGRNPAVLVDILLEIAAIVDPNDRSDGLTDPGDHRRKLEVAVRDVHRDDTARLELAEIKLQRLAR